MKLNAIGVGPGDKGDVSLKAKMLIEESDVLFVPIKKEGEKSFALSIVNEFVKENTEIVELEFPMHYNLETLDVAWKRNAQMIFEALKSNDKSASFIVIGDIMLYSTYFYVDKYLREFGINVTYVPGITSYSSVSSIIGSPLAMKEEGLAIIPASRDSEFNFEEILTLFDNVVIMKPSHSKEKIIDVIKKFNLENKFKLIYKAGTEEMRIYSSIEELSEGIPYLSTLIIKKKGF